ncbi:MAG: SIS domain-containing protein [Planctomycetes bacterium]|nr:SIS domain-containing protein [Planctomycetota bacterium]
MIPETLMYREIREQPHLLKEIDAQVRVFLRDHVDSLRACRSLHFLGCGDMDFTSRMAASLVTRPRSRVWAHRSMDLRWMTSGWTEDDLVVAASFSGRTPRTIEAARAAKKRGARVWGLTGNADSPLTGEVDTVFVLKTDPQEEMERHYYPGYRHIIPQTKTFVAMLLTKLRLIETMGELEEGDGAALDDLSDVLTKNRAALERGVVRFMDQGFRAVQRVAVLGSGPWRGLAAFGAAKLLEMAVPARYQCLEENNHLEMFVTRKDDLVVLLAPDRPSFTRARELFEPYAKFGALRLLMAPADILEETGTGFAVHGKDGGWIIPLPPGDRITQLFQTATSLSLLTASIGPALGRDIDQWVGGVRRPLIEKMGLNLVRGSRIED